MASWPLVGTASLYVRQSARLLARRPPLSALAAPLDDRLVFVVGSPRSGTTFVARAIGSLPGFLDLGEVLPLKAAIPRLVELEPGDAARRLRRILSATRRLGAAGGVRGVEQTPECAYLGRAVALAYPQATALHLLRDGRDVVASLLERGWLSGEEGGRDDAGLATGSAPRFWVERGREHEFAAASDARRAAWAWRRYVESARSLESAHVVRYERLCTEPERTAAELAEILGAPPDRLAGALSAADPSSVGRFRRDLDAAKLADVEAEAGVLLAELGYR